MLSSPGCCLGPLLTPLSFAEAKHNKACRESSSCVTCVPQKRSSVWGRDLEHKWGTTLSMYERTFNQWIADDVTNGLNYCCCVSHFCTTLAFYISTWLLWIWTYQGNTKLIFWSKSKSGNVSLNAVAMSLSNSCNSTMRCFH